MKNFYLYIKKIFSDSFNLLFKKDSIKVKIIYICISLLIFSSLVIFLFSITLIIFDKKRSLAERMESICFNMKDNILKNTENIIEEIKEISKSDELNSYINYYDENYITQLFINKNDIFYEISFINTDYMEELKIIILTINQ